jgi:hypothetical protein
MRRKTGEYEAGKSRLTQQAIVREALLSAAKYDQWMTLGELARMTHYPEASISAQLRHLRKPEFGGYVVEKRRRAVAEAARGSAHEKAWEYQMRHGKWLVVGEEPARSYAEAK